MEGPAPAELDDSDVQIIEPETSDVIEVINEPKQRQQQISTIRRFNLFNYVSLTQTYLLNTTTVDVTIINDTNCILNVSFKTLAPLFFENRLMPGHATTKRVPRFVYTIEARVWTGNNDYNLMRETVLPAAFLVATAASFAGSAAARTASILTRSPAWMSRALTAGRPIFTVGRAIFATRASKEVLSSLISGSAIRSHGWNCTKSRTLVIRGGPAVSIALADGQTHQYIELGDQFDGFYISEPFVQSELPEASGSKDD